MQPSAVNQEAEALLHWKLAVQAMAAGAPEWREVALDRMSVVWADTMFPLTNHFFVEQPCDTETIADQATEFAASSAVPWMLTCLSDWLGTGGAKSLEQRGLVPAMRLTYMTAGRLRTPTRPEPPAEYRLVDSAELAGIVSDLNSDAYGMPREWGRSALSDPRLWTEEGVGVLAYVDGQPVSTATVVPTAGCLNVICVATATEYRGRGHAEAVMRRALDLAERELKLSRTVLHASDMGLPIYKRMGYQPSTTFTVFAPEHG